MDKKKTIALVGLTEIQERVQFLMLLQECTSIQEIGTAKQ